MRGFKRDTKLTLLMRHNGFFLDRRSFIGYNSDMIPHLLLAGVDVGLQRTKVFLRSERQGIPCCVICRRKLQSEEWEMDHIKSKGMGGSDDLWNLRALCVDCHRNRHVQVKFGAGRPEAIKSSRGSIDERT